MAENFLYLTTTGRTTGLPREIEIWYVERAGRYYMVSQGRDRSHWVRNIQRHDRVSFSIGTRDEPAAVREPTAAKGRPLHDDEPAALVAAVRELMDEKYDWSDGLVVELIPDDLTS